MRKLMLHFLATALIALALCAQQVQALDLVTARRAMTRWVRATGETQVFPNGISGQFFSTWVNPQDSSGWTIWDELYRVVTIRVTENGDTIYVPETRYTEFTAKTQMVMEPGGLQYTSLWRSVGSKYDQGSPDIDANDARRAWTASETDDYWPDYSSGWNQNHNPTDFDRVVRPYYTNIYGVFFLNQVPDIMTDIGVNPARIMYWSETMWFAPRPGYSDTLFVADDSCGGQVLWTENDGNHPDFPSTPVISSLRPDPSNPLVYTCPVANLGPLSGTCAVAVQRLMPNSFEMATVATLIYDAASRSNDFVLTLTPPQSCANPQVVAFTSQTTGLVVRVPLETRDVRFPQDLRIVGVTND